VRDEASLSQISSSSVDGKSIKLTHIQNEQRLLKEIVDHLATQLEILEGKTQKNKAKVKIMISEQKNWLDQHILSEFVKFKHML
jgi:uncharacterized spore protein YtfJ